MKKTLFFLSILMLSWLFVSCSTESSSSEDKKEETKEYTVTLKMGGTETELGTLKVEDGTDLLAKSGENTTTSLFLKDADLDAKDKGALKGSTFDKNYLYTDKDTTALLAAKITADTTLYVKYGWKVTLKSGSSTALTATAENALLAAVPAVVVADGKKLSSSGMAEFFAISENKVTEADKKALAGVKSFLTPLLTDASKSFEAKPFTDAATQGGSEIDGDTTYSADGDLFVNLK